MKIHKVISILTCVIFLSCNNEGASRKREKEKQSANTNFFPIADYIRGEIRNIDSLPVGILKKVIINNNLIDSAFIQREEFEILVKEFLSDDIEKGNFEKKFRENSFIDQTVGSATFTYSSLDPSTAVQRVDISVKPGSAFNKVKNIYIEKATADRDTLTLKKMIWKTGNSFQIITQKQYKQTSFPVEQIKVVWDPTDY